jgi:hypothetical protein
MAIVISEANKSKYETWFSRAIADDAVWPYLSFDKWVEMKKVDNGDWARVVLMDDSENALLVWTQDRDSGNHSANVCLWSLSGPSQRMAAGKLCLSLDGLARRYGVSFVDAACHASNDNSLHILERRFGSPWGVKPRGAWNGKLGVFEDSVHFRVAA